MRCALVPIKDLARAKERLSPLLSPSERRRLAGAMLDDVLAALERSSELERIALVTSDEQALSIADQRGFVAIDEGTERGLTEAVQLGTRACQALGTTSLVIIPGDIPLMTSGDVNRIMQCGSEYTMVIVPSWNSRGTNAVCLHPPDALPLRFGSWSFFPHVKQAKRAGLAYKVLRLPRVALDVDTPEDLGRLAAQAKGTQTYTALREIGILDRLRVG